MPIDPNRISVRPATPADIDFVAMVSEICMRDYAEQTFGVWDAEIPCTHFRSNQYKIVCVDDDDAGCLNVVYEADFLRLSVLYLLPRIQKQGISTELLQQVIERAEAVGKPLRLRVLRVNPARRLYERHGFSVIGTTPERFFMERPVHG